VRGANAIIASDGREHNRLDDELYEFGKKLFEQNLRKKEDAVREGLTSLRAIPRPGY
jgi:N6-adenosine-specific RNA methylase IME4